MLLASFALAAPDDLGSALKAIADAAAAKHNCSISLSVRTPSLFASRAAGTIDMAGAVAAKPSDRYAWGSVTKTMTGAAIFKHIAAGRLTLDAKAAPLCGIGAAAAPAEARVVDVARSPAPVAAAAPKASKPKAAAAPPPAAPRSGGLAAELADLRRHVDARFDALERKLDAVLARL